MHSTQNLTSVWPSVNISYYFNLAFLMWGSLPYQLFSPIESKLVPNLYFGQGRENEISSGADGSDVTVDVGFR